jgi:glucose/arabinose dehydrogenase
MNSSSHSEPPVKRRFRLRSLLLLAGALLVALVGLGAGLCRFGGLDCHLGEPKKQRIAGTGDTTLPAGFAQDVVASELELATSFTFLPDGRVLVAQKNGLVRVVEDGTVLAEPFLDLSRAVNTRFNRGLLAVEADPEFDQNGFVYLYYVYEDGSTPADAAKSVRVSRVRADGDTAVPGSEEVVLGTQSGGSCNDLPAGADCIPSDGDHSGGDIEFAPDSTMFVTTGDGWFGVQGFSPNSLRAQNLDLLGGKLLHVTREGDGLPSNPFWNGDPDTNRSKVWAYGLRNPWRFTLRPGSEVAYVGDVGWNHWEEVDVVRKGENHGWPCYEGRERPAEYHTNQVCRELYRQGRDAVRFPLKAHRHPKDANTVIGGAFYSGSEYPREYRGAYFYADWGRDWMRTLRVEGDRLVEGSVRRLASGVAGPVEIRSGPDGNIYYLAINAGELRRVRYDGGE